MDLHTFTSPFIITFILLQCLLFHFSSSNVDLISIPESDVELLEFPLNLEYLEAEFFLWGALGYGLDIVDPNLTSGGPSPVGARMARLDPLTKDFILQFGYQEVGHLRAIKGIVKGFPRPLLNLTSDVFAQIMNSAVGHPLHPPFDPYADGLNFLLASYVVPYVGMTGYVGANPRLQAPTSKKLLAGLLAVEAGQDAIIRALLYERAAMEVKPYGITVEEFTNRISQLRDKLGKSQSVKDEGLIVPLNLGAEGKIKGNALVGDENSLGYPRTPEEILRIIYGTGNEQVPGALYPMGGNGRIAKSYLSANHHER